MGDTIAVIANSKYYKEYRSSCAYYLYCQQASYFEKLSK